MEAPIRVLVADDQAIVRDGLVTVLGLLADVVVVGEAADGEEAVALVADLSPDVVLMDLRMPRLDGAAATARIVARHPATAVLVLTTYADDASVLSALQAGARGYLTKDAGRAEVAAAVRAVAHGQTTLAAHVGARLVDAAAGRRTPEPTDADALLRRFPALTPREAQVLAEISRGRTNPEIARLLFVGIATVKTHVNSLFAKLNVQSRAQAVALAVGTSPSEPVPPARR